MPDVLIYADTIRSPELRHEVPLLIGDPLIYVESGGERYVFAGSLELPRLVEVDGLRPDAFEALGFDELLQSGVSRRDAEPELVLRACKELGLTHAVVPRSFPVGVADLVRSGGVELEPDAEFFARRRRAKTGAELAGIRRAVRASELALARVRELLDSGPQTCEGLRTEIVRVVTEEGAGSPDPPIVSHGAQTAIGHDPGSGAIAPGEPVVVDLFPQDPDSGCYSDLTRTFCVGEPPEELVTYHRLCKEALDLVLPEIRPGASGEELHRLSCSVFEAAGYPTQLTKAPGEVLEEGFYHALGHGVGLELHEAPNVGRRGDELVAGDVVAIEPGCYRPGFGGCRLEDVVLVTDSGAELLSHFPHDL
jgi:Xaa-Pro aminopeptidase